MKLDPHMEIDRLLRRHARQRSPLAPMVFAARDESGRDGGEALREPDGFAHLDADEMIAYAENALPPAARSRYTEHLADCDSCRKLVTELALSSGVAIQLEQQAATQAATSSVPARSWRDWLRAMFAPAKLRYAASVLLVLGIVAIAVMVFRNKRMGFEPTVSRQTQEAQPQSASKNSNTVAPVTTDDQPKPEGGTAPASASPPPGLLSKEDTTTSPPQGTGTESSALRDEPQKSGSVQGPTGETPAPPPATSSDNFELPKNPARDEDNEDAKTAQPALSAPSPEDKRKAKKEIDGADSTDEQARLQSNRERTNNTKSAAPSENKPQYGKAEESAGRRARGSAASSPPKDAPPSSADAASGAAMDDRAEGAGRADKSAEKRSVGGKQFVRRGGAWVDTAYSSQATTNVRRGTEQYRALAADEPGLRDIANQLGGEVIIVWKGRAYRIR